VTPDRYAVIGHPVEHSRSPAIHAAFARQTGQVLVYERVLSPLDGFEQTLAAFASEHGLGCNVTVPFKFQAYRLAQLHSTRAALALAANVLTRQDGRWLAENTDGVGLVRDIEHNAGLALHFLRVLLIGAGGAAAGVLGPLLAARPMSVVVVNRTADRAAELVDRHAAWAAQHDVELECRELADPGQGHDVVINASASSLHGAAVPVNPRAVAQGGLAVDLMYGPAAAPLLRWAEAAGAIGRDGLGMLVEQAAEAFRVWRGVRPQTAPVLAALRAEAGDPG
jgi:shikimate dehydrogenase